MCTIKSNKFFAKSKEKDSEFYTRITDREVQFYADFGLKTKHVLLLKRLCVFAKKQEEFSVKNSYLQSFCMVSSRTTIHSFLKKLESSGFIQISIQTVCIGGQIKKYRTFKVNWDSLCPNSGHKKLNNNKAKAVVQEISVSPKKDSFAKGKEKLTMIFNKKCEELGYSIHMEDLKHESERFSEYYQCKGFNQWERNGKRHTFRAVTHWILNDKYGVFYEYRERKKIDLFEQKIIRQKIQDKKIEQQREDYFNRFGEIIQYHRELITQNWRKNTNLSDSEILEQLRDKFPSHMLKEYERSL